MKSNSLKKWIIAIVAVILVAALVVGLVIFLPGSGTSVNVYAFENLGMTEYWGDSQESDGTVRTDKVQTVYLSETQTVTEILVKPGDTVKKGDTLLSFDTTLSDLSVERKRLEVEKLKLQLLDAQEQLAKINAMRPMVFPDTPTPEEKPQQGTPLAGDYQISLDTAYDGSTQEKSIICWISSQVDITDAVLDALLDTAVKYQTINAELIPPEEVPGTPAPEGSTEQTEPTEPTEPEEPQPVIVESFHVIFKVTEGNTSQGFVNTWQGMVISRKGGQYGMRFFDASGIDDHTLSKEEQEEVPEIDFGSGFTAAQIAQMRVEQEKQIRDINFNIKMAESEYKIMLTEVSDGNVYAQVDGTVVSVQNPEEAFMNGQPIVKVSGGGGFYVDGSISELDRDQLQIGSEVTVNDWYTGMTYVGKISHIGDYPSAGDYWYGNGNPNATRYPFTVFVEDTADLQSGSYVSITYSSGSSENGIYLENPFLRTEGGVSFVYVMNAESKLEKRNVVVGRSLWGSYTEILSGITAEDYLAFPYGKDVRDGAPVVIADISELYQ